MSNPQGPINAPKIGQSRVYNVYKPICTIARLCDADYMKTKNQRDLQKHWAEQARKKTPAEQLRIKAEKLREKIERDQEPSDQGGGDNAQNPETRKKEKRTQ